MNSWALKLLILTCQHPMGNAINYSKITHRQMLLVGNVICKTIIIGTQMSPDWVPLLKKRKEKKKKNSL